LNEEEILDIVEEVEAVQAKPAEPKPAPVNQEAFILPPLVTPPVPAPVPSTTPATPPKKLRKYPEYSKYIEIKHWKITEFERFYNKTKKDLTIHSGTDPQFANPDDRSKLINADPPPVTPLAQRILNAALHKFDNKEYETALSLFGSLLEEDKDDVNALFYSAVCLHKLNKPAEAIPYLNRVIASTNDAFLQEAYWYKAQCLVESGEIEVAQIVLESITRYDGFYREQAEKLLEIVNKQ
jgi:tetratricopeptide (TPR) repeat protein